MNMQIVLRERLWRYIIDSRPDLMISMQNRQGISTFLKEKVEAVMPTAMGLTALGMSDYLVEEYCFNELTKELRPSRYKYLLNILKKHFPEEFKRYTETGMLLQEIIHLIEYTDEAFEIFNVSDDHLMDPAFESTLSRMIGDYFESK